MCKQTTLEIHNTYDIPWLNVCQSLFVESTFTESLRYVCIVLDAIEIQQ